MQRDVLLQYALLEGQELMLIQQQLAQAQQRRRRQRAMWVRPWLAADRRLQFGQYDQLMTELRLEDHHSFTNYLRMEPAMFDEILQRVGPSITRQDTRMRRALEPGLKLAVTLRYLATGDKYPTLQYDYRVARNTISLFVPEVCRAITEVYKDEVIKCPTTAEEWRPISEEFPCLCCSGWKACGHQMSTKHWQSLPQL